eukprot:TRINITY_DN10731_c0_g1_i1.p1 TRINITY_DN10731_c0_g1~~TRINITY_DN10731_c0_g1_i1.p1  ORF type:complete len:506 (+),score=93.85 TRINITY_DN10731_c0_g1_i1:35-1552(+)
MLSLLILFIFTHLLYLFFLFFFLMIRRPPRSTLSSSSAASDVYKRQASIHSSLIISQSEPLAPRFGAYLLSNNRGTDATYTLHGTKELCTAVQAALQGRESNLDAVLVLSLMYEDTKTEVEMFTRHQYSDHISVIPSTGGRKNAEILSTAPRVVLQSSPLAAPGHMLLEALDSEKFASTGQVYREADGFCLAVSIRLSTNITRTAHGDRRMFWRAQLQITQGGQTVDTQIDSPGFVYLAREPKEVPNMPKIETLICDGRPNDLLILHGVNLGSTNQALVCRVDFPPEKGIPSLVLDREASHSSSCFTTRLPPDIPPGAAAVCVFVRNSPDVQSGTSPLRVLAPTDPPALPLEAPRDMFPLELQPLQATTIQPVVAQTEPFPLLPGTVECEPTAGKIGSTTKTARRQQRHSRKDTPYQQPCALQQLSTSPWAAAPRNQISLNRQSAEDFLRNCPLELPAGGACSELFMSGLLSMPTSRANSRANSQCGAQSRTASQDLAIMFGTVA